MRVIRLGAAAVAVLVLAGCAVAPPVGPSVAAMPGQGKTFEAFQADDVACRQYAALQTGVAPQDAANQSFVGSTALGTVLGAAAGAAIGAAAGNPAMGAAIGAGSGAVLGTGYGAGAAQYSADTVQYRYDTGYVQCMSARACRRCRRRQPPMLRRRPIRPIPIQLIILTTPITRTTTARPLLASALGGDGLAAMAGMAAGVADITTKSVAGRQGALFPRIW